MIESFDDGETSLDRRREMFEIRKLLKGLMMNICKNYRESGLHDEICFATYAVGDMTEFGKLCI